jgi:hypothetical protein
MKSLLLSIFLIVLVTFKLASQKAFYFNFSAGGAFIKDKYDYGYGLFNSGDAIPYGIFNAGAIINNYFRLGPSVGYLKFRNTNKAYIPVGIDFFSDLIKDKKVSPVLNLGVYYPIHDDERSYSGMNPYGDYSASSTSYKGRFMANLGAGLGLRGPGKVSFNILGHFMPLYTTYHYSSANSLGTGSIDDENITTNVFSFSLDVLFIGKSSQKKK